VLVYDRPLSQNGLTRRELIDWWAATGHDPGPDGLSPERTLGARLSRTLDSKAEKVLARAYRGRFDNEEDAGNAPALIPQVYLHYDPYTRRELETMPGGELARQRMDFLMLLPGRRRVVIEVDGKHHYTENAYTPDAKPSPRLYAEMVAEDRRIRLAGYEVFRFGGYELMQDDSAEMVKRFFDQLLA
jgi:hypothetical protein